MFNKEECLNKLELIDRLASYVAMKTNGLEEYLMTWKDTSDIYNLGLKIYEVLYKHVSDLVF